jgi:hypothetical protein
MSVDQIIEQMAEDALFEIRVRFSIARKEMEARFATLRRRKGQLFRKRDNRGAA